MKTIQSKTSCKICTAIKHASRVIGGFIFSIFYFGYLDSEFLLEISKSNQVWFFWTVSIKGFIAMSICMCIALYYQKECKSAKKDSNIDSKTGLYNDKFIDQAVKIIFSQALSNSHCKIKSYFCCVLIDIDDFKLVNDNYGHKIGDLALCGLANKIFDLVRGDIVLRWGGDEFLILFAASNPRQFLRKLLAAMKSGITFHNEQLRVTCTMGFGQAKVATDSTAKGDQLYEEIFLKADESLRKRKERKHAGR